MKKLLSLIAVLLVAVTGMLGQSPAPGILNYQGVARNSVGNVLVNKSITLRLTIRDGSAAGPVVYQESRGVTTNPFGLFNVQLGSPGASAVTGTIAGVPWGVGLKYIQVEIDPNGGSSFINIGTAQLASVPYSLYSSLANDLVLPFDKTQADAGTLFRITNSGTGSGSTALEGRTNSTAGNANAIIGTVTSTAPGGFSSGVRGINNGTGGLGIGVYGSQAGSGWGVYGTTPSGRGVYGESNTGIGVAGSSSTNAGVFGTSNTNNAGYFFNSNNANTAPTVNITTTGSGDALNVLTSGTGRAGMFQNTNAANTQHVFAVNNVAGASGHAINSTTAGTGSAGLFNINNSASAATALQATHNGTGANIFAVSGTISSATPATNSTGLRGINNGTAGLGIGVWGSQNGSGWGVYGSTPNGTSIRGDVTAGTGGTAFAVRGVASGTNPFAGGAFQGQTGSFYGGYGDINNPAGFAGLVGFQLNTAPTSGFSSGVIGINNATNAIGQGGYFEHAGGGFGVFGTSNTGIAGAFTKANAANTNPTIRAQDADVTSTGFGNGSVFAQKGAGGIVLSGQTAIKGVSNMASGVGVNGGSQTGIGTAGVTTTGIGLVGLASSPLVGYGLVTVGRVQIQGNGAALNRILTSDATGNATWQPLAAIGIVGGSGTLDFIPKWTPDGNTLGNSLLFDNGTGVGLGTTTPSHRFSVSHSGSTGISVTSTAGFSVVDINAQSGDAALRFGNNGVNQWNMRNRPGDDYLEIFELGGGGSRVVIQDATGNVGIGATVSPSYKLDVEHSGSTGIRSLSTGSFSVVDIDGFTGDAALRFQKQGVGVWNTRNRPGDDYYEIFELGGGGSRFVIQDGTGNVGIGATVSPSYKLDVEHSGSTGIRSLSTGSFSVVDIDGFTGDAALRFQKQGVGVWNTRNRPADDYYEIFELGGGGSRFVIQDGTGNVGIGETTAPSYKLDVLHGGATGIRSRSSSTFSLVDIDAANGDAALRFQKAGVNQWNIRNRPGDDYLEIFELGGGGSRIVIQDGTGNLGVGETVSPSYKLDVLHGGATGIRSRSSSTFSLVDIDGANGDAALRFQNAGVNQWNIRNNPANDDLQFYELGGGERMRIENTTGNVVVTGNLSKGGGSFKIDHPLDPENKYLYHSFVESPDMMNIYNGNVVTDAAGKVTVQLPDYFEALNMEYRYQLTVIGSFAQAIISREVANNTFEIATNQPNIKVSWQVTGVRHDAYANQNRIPNAVEKEKENKGKYLHPKAFNQPLTKAIGNTNAADGISSLNFVAPVSDKTASVATGGSLDQQPIIPPAAVKPDNSGSVANTEPVKAVVKPADISGSVIQTEAIKPSSRKADNSGSVSEEMQKPVIKTQEPKAEKAKPIAAKEAPTPQSTAPALKVETVTESQVPGVPAAKPPVAPPAGKQE